MWSFEGCSLNGRWVKRFWPFQSSLWDWAERVMLGHMSQEQEELSVKECENHKPPPPSRPVARLPRGSGALCFFFFFLHWHPVSTVKQYKHTPVLQWRMTSWSWLYNNNCSIFTTSTIYMTVIAVVWLPYLPADTVLVLMIGLSIANSSCDDETAQQCLPDNILRL